MATIGETFRRGEGWVLAALSGASGIGELFVGKAVLEPGLEDFAKAVLSVFNSPVESAMYLLQILPDIAKGAEAGNPLADLTILFTFGAAAMGVVKGIKMATE